MSISFVPNCQKTHFPPQNLAGGKVVLATHAQSAESPAVASGVGALAGAPLPPLDLDFDSLSFGLVHLFAKNLPMMRSLGDFYRKLPDTFIGLQKRLGTILTGPIY